MIPRLPGWVPRTTGGLRPRISTVDIFEALLPLDVWCDDCGTVHPDRTFVCVLNLN